MNEKQMIRYANNFSIATFYKVSLAPLPQLLQLPLLAHVYTSPSSSRPIFVLGLINIPYVCRTQ